MPFYFRKECPLNSGYLIIPDRIAFLVVLTRPDKTTLRIEITRRWEATINAV
ncbi:Bacteriophage protein GP46 [Shigella boydii ATCC 9905]|nr:Bacteriophage protein GP46 [Shigella boydii ATCC 9905]